MEGGITGSEGSVWNASSPELFGEGARGADSEEVSFRARRVRDHVTVTDGFDCCRLPQIIDSIRKQHAEVKEELGSLPPPPTDNQTFLVHNLIRDFDTALGCRLRGDSGHNDFQKELRRTAEEFQRALKVVRPTILLIGDLREETAIASSLDSPRKAGASGRGNRQENEWFGDREREASPSLRKGRKNQQPEIHFLSSDEGPGSQSKKRRGPNDQMATPVSKKSKRIPNFISETERVYLSHIFPISTYTGWEAICSGLLDYH